MAIQGLIFDFDGLIIDTELPIFQAWSELYETYGCQLSLDKWVTIIGTAYGDFDPAQELERQLGYKLDWSEIEPVRQQRELELIYSMPPLPGVTELLHAAKTAGLKIALASSSTCAWVTGHLTRLGLIHFFDCIIARDDVQYTKPNPELFLAALNCLDLTPRQAIVFEDSPNGILAAKRAGIYTVAAPSSLTRGLPMEQADLQISSLAERPLDELLRLASLAQNPS